MTQHVHAGLLSADVVTVESTGGVAQVRRAGSTQWQTELPGDVSAQTPTFQSQDGALYVPWQASDGVGLTRLNGESGAIVWSARVPGHFTGVAAGLPSAVAIGDRLAIVRDGADVHAVVLEDGTVWSHRDVPIDGPSRLPVAGDAWGGVVDTNRLRVWDVTGELLVDVATYPGGVVATGRQILWRDANRQHMRWRFGEEPTPVELPGRLRPTGWVLPDGSHIVGLHGVDGQPAVARITAEGALAWSQSVEGLGWVGETVAETGSTVVPMLLDIGNVQHRVVTVSVEQGTVTLGNPIPASQLITSAHHGGRAHAAIVSESGIVAVSSGGVASYVGSHIGVGLDSEVASVLRSEPTGTVRVELPQQNVGFGWNVGDSDESH